MGSVILPAIGIAVATALIGSLVFQSSAPNPELSPFLALEEKCEKIASEGYKFHLKYPESNLDEIPIDDMNALIHLDTLWIEDCVNRLPAATVFDIINNVERDFHSGE